jgi:hypothetical protein
VPGTGLAPGCGVIMIPQLLKIALEVADDTGVSVINISVNYDYVAIMDVGTTEILQKILVANVATTDHGIFFVHYNVFVVKTIVPSPWLSKIEWLIESHFYIGMGL